VKRACCARLGGACVVCGITDIRVLTFDHIHGRTQKRVGGLVKTKLGRWHVQSSTAEVCRRYRNGTLHVYQLMCRNCHAIKTWESKEQKGSRLKQPEPEAEIIDLFTRLKIKT
jgi:hypothetical protein